MCIVLATTAHPDYALIVIDNRDEFILRPTSRPHWWSSGSQDILSARDLQRAEQGTWLGITRSGNFAVLTNYRETDTNDKDHPVQGQRSRGGMVTAWMTAPVDETTTEFVHRLLSGEGVKGVGGFSLVCGKLRKHFVGNQKELEPMAIVSNRSGIADEVPWIGGKRNEVYGLSNTSYDDPEPWPKVEMGKEKLLQVVDETVQNQLSEEELVARLYDILDTDTLPLQSGEDFEEYIYHLRKSIFIPSIGSADPVSQIPKAEDIAAAEPLTNGHKDLDLREFAPAANQAGMSGIYGTHRQTIMLVKWDGTVSLRERALWDDEGNPIPRGKADMAFEFKVEGWDGKGQQNGIH
ncbi:MAG: hypothetical protein M1818_008460 [Claussenomyces sp. TS43310]|nr:MAG: hypothetical protein M1818_008460 [Claussenomyces sp. TS43310]